MGMLGGIALSPLKTEILVDIAGFKSDMDKVAVEAEKKANEVSKAMTGAADVGKSMSKVGDTATKLITLPLLGAAAAASKLSMDLSENMGMVSTLLDGNFEQVQARTADLKKDVYELSNEVNISTGIIADGMYQVISAYGDTAESSEILEIAAKGAKAANTDVTSSVNLLSAVTKGYGDTSAEANQKASDLAFMTAKLGQTTFPELAGSIGQVVPLANSLSVSQEELFGIMATGTGVTGNAAAVSTQFKGILQSLMAPTDSMTKLLAKMGFESGQAMVESLGLQGTIDTITKAAEESGQPLQDYIGSIEGQTLAIALSGAQHDVLTEKMSKMQDVSGATEEAFSRVSSTTGEKFSSSINKAKNALTKLGDAAAPIIEKISDIIGKFADALGNMSEQQIETVLKIGATVAAAGPLLKMGGGLLTGATKLTPALVKVTELFKGGIPLLGKLAAGAGSAASATATVATATGGVASAASVAGGAAGLGGFISALGSAAVAALPVVAGVAAVGVAGYALYKGLTQEVIPSVNLFKDSVEVAYDEAGNITSLTTIKISEETQKQVQSYIDLSNAAQQESMLMYSGLNQITSENVTSITSKVVDMSTQITNAVKTQSDNVKAGFQDMFNQTTVLTEEEKTQILATVDEECVSRVERVLDLQEELSGIYQQISDSGVGITQTQQERIDQIYEEMKVMAVQSMAQNEAEQNVILNRLSASNKRVTAEMAGETIQQMNELRDKSVQSAAEKRDALVMEAEKLKTLEGGKYAEKAQMIIDSANKEYDSVVENAEKIRTEGVQKVMDSHTELKGKVDEETGKIMGLWEQMQYAWDSWFPQPKKVVTEHVDVYSSSGGGGQDSQFGYYNGLSYVPHDGYNARLHKGERVLTEEENRDYTQGSGGKNRNGRIVLEVPIQIDGKEIAIATKEFMSEELAFI